MLNDCPDSSSRRTFLQAGVMSGVAAAFAPMESSTSNLAMAGSAGRTEAAVPSFELDEITIAELQQGMESGRFTARSLRNTWRVSKPSIGADLRFGR